MLQKLIAIFVDKRRWSNPATYASLAGLVVLILKSMGYDIDESVVVDQVTTIAAAVITLVGLFADLKTKGFSDNP